MSPSDAELLSLLQGVTTIAVVGASTNERKAAYQIPRILIEAGYTVLPVNPTATEILGRPVHARLADVPVPVDVVDVFRPAEEAPGVAEQAAAIGARVLWLQEGLSSPAARRIAEAAGMVYVEDTCIGHTTRRLGARPASAT